MSICPAVCTTTYEIVLNVYSIAALTVIIIAAALKYTKKIKTWFLVLIIFLSLATAVLVCVKINTCDSGCKKNNAIEFENELFGEPKGDQY